ncbi:MAG TPA: DUF3014 domain-containing protein [Albitalea sp.]|nr:DUF3014 domain-containing protein [Albitalea sp.]
MPPASGMEHSPVKKTWMMVVALWVVVLAGGAALWWFQTRPSPPPPAQAAAAPPPAAPASAPSQPAIRYPVEAAAPAASAPAPLDVESALIELFGRKAVLSTFLLDDFPRRVVATVDNLARAHAPTRVWPVNPAPERFVVEHRADGDVIGPDNGLRYTPFVLLVETVDMHQAVASYARLYPLFQQAYEDLGYPKRYFNDRLVEVIDLLLATPEPDGPLHVHLPAIKGPLQPERPWVLYEFDDPALQSLAAGQRMLLRMGPVNERRMKAKLAELRRLLTSPGAPR